MRIDWRAGVGLLLVTALAGCGSYSSPSNNPRMSSDSTGDTTRSSPNYSPR